jgi:nucleotide-binding universal stress UspA family protein
VGSEMCIRDRDEEIQGRKILDEATVILKEAGVESNTVMPRGDAASEILAYAKEHQADLIVCGSRGLSEISGWLLGSVSRKLVHYAGCSVLIVK